MSKIEKKIINKIHKMMNHHDILYFDFRYEIEDAINFMIEKIKFDECEYKAKELRLRIKNHSRRVKNLSDKICQFIEENSISSISKYDRYLLEIAALYHDIGKIYSNENHELYSVIILDYILNLDLRYNPNTKLTASGIEKILMIVKNHTKKKKNVDTIDICSKILRDADNLDENCGYPLLQLLTSSIDNESKKHTLNRQKYIKSDSILLEKIDPRHMDNVIERLNIPENIYLYKNLLIWAVEEYDMISDLHRYEYKRNGGIVEDDGYIIRIYK